MKGCIRFFCATITLLAATAATAAEPAPGDACTTAGAFMRSAGPEVSGGGHFLVCDGANWVSVLDYQDGGTTLTQVGNDTGSCTAAKDGRIRYTGGDPPWEYCDGGATTWRPFKQPRCQDDDTGECYLGATRSNDDPDFTAANITSGTNILGVEGTAGSIQITGSVTSTELNSAYGVQVTGDYAYVTASTGDSLNVVDISDPTNPTQTGSVTSTDLDSARNLAVSGNYAYVASSSADSLTAIDISNPAGPAQVGTISNANLNGAIDVAISGHYAFVASQSADALTAIDISSPASLTETSSLTSANLDNIANVVVAGDYAYVSSRYGSSDRLVVIDISDPTNMSEVGVVARGGDDLAVAGDYAYTVNFNSHTLYVIDISNPASPTEAGSAVIGTLSGTNHIAVAGDYAYITNTNTHGIIVVDISVPASPVEVASIETPWGSTLTSPNGIAVSGQYAYVSTSISDALTIVDLAGYPALYNDCSADNTDTCVLDQSRVKYDTDFQPENIASGVNILGVTGTLSGGGCAAPTSCPIVGEVCSDGSLFAGFLAADDGSCRAIFVTDDNQSTSSQWKTATGTNDITDPDDHVDGQYNRDNRGGGTFPAFELCENNTYHNKNDWYLPAHAELNLLWLNHAAIDANAAGNFGTDYYWSSTEQSAPYSWSVRFSNASQGGINKTYQFSVRCVRSEDASAAASGCTAPSSGLVAHFEFEDGSGTTATNSAGANDGTLGPSGSEPVWTTGKSGGALLFDGDQSGTGDRVSVTEYAALDLTSFTLGAWATFDLSYTGSFNIVQKMTNYYIYYYSGNLVCGFESGGSGRDMIASFSPVDGEWYHVGCTFDNGTKEGAVYVNGIPLKNQTLNYTPAVNNDPIWIGRDQVWDDSTHKGKIDDVRIYNDALTSAEMSQLSCSGG